MAILNYRISAIVIALFIIFLSFATPSFAEKVTFVKEYTYQASEIDSKASCRTISLEMVKRLLLEELGVYLISETEVKDFKLTKDQVKTYSAGIVGAEIIEDKWDGKTYWLKARVSADPKEVAKALKKIMDDQFKAHELEETRKKAEELTKEVERLKLEFAKTEAKKEQPSQKIEREYKTAIQGLTVIEWFERGYEATMAERWQEALDAFTKAIKLNPNLAEAYACRGIAYYYLGNYQQAINDLTRAIELKPNNYGKNALAYLFRGDAYGKLDDNLQALKDCTKAIELKPDLASAYIRRGMVYIGLGNYQKAIMDYTIAIELKQDLADAYLGRGIAYANLGNSQQSIKDSQIAARLGNTIAQKWLREAGITW